MICCFGIQYSVDERSQGSGLSLPVSVTDTDSFDGCFVLLVRMHINQVFLPYVVIFGFVFKHQL